ncbi:formyltransferase family protein [Devosia sp.]|uniref:formyltransferase family protein n=1 Tax=Devosia sp. TaxID=1871048 RepID=UPI0035B103EC
MAVALFIGADGVLSAGALRGWLEAGNVVAEYWTDYPPRPRPSLESLLAPDWTVRGLLRRHGIAQRAVRLRALADARAEVRRLAVDTLITAVTMQIVRPEILDLFGARAVNFHPALLPFYRGPSPFLGTMLDERDDCAGATLHVLSPGIDEGPVIDQIAVPYEATGRRYAAWVARHALAFRRLARDSLPSYLRGGLSARPQAPGSYRRVTEEAILGAGVSLDEARRRLRLAERSRRLVTMVPGRSRPVSLKRLPAVLGPSTGARPRLGLFSVEFDLADARVRIARTTGIDRQLDRVESLAELLGAQL